MGIRFDENQCQQGTDPQLKLAMVQVFVSRLIFVVACACAHLNLSVLLSPLLFSRNVLS